MYLLAYDINLYSWTTLNYFGHVAHSTPDDVFGSLYGSPGGYIYGLDNYAGDIWRFPITGYPGLPSYNVTAPNGFVQGPIPGPFGDGARCYYANLNGTIQTSAYYA